MPNQSTFDDAVSHLPFSQASENNKQAILGILNSAFASCEHVLEIGSGTGQHACFFAEHLNVTWQPTNLVLEDTGLVERVAAASLQNIRAPSILDVRQKTWPVGFDAVFSANTAHIMPWPSVEQMMANVGEFLPEGGIFVLYGPFKYEGEFTSESNAEFDVWLKARGAHQGIRDVESVASRAERACLDLVCDHAMPANNQALVFKKNCVNTVKRDS